MFQPPRCPNTDCPEHTSPSPRFYVRRGYYHPLCRAHPVPRFRCRTCRRGFSRQTFRADYRDHKPQLNQAVFLSLATGLGLRQTARNVRLSRRCTELKFRKLARHLTHLNLNLRSTLPPGSTLQMDELETYEGRRNTRPLTLPVLIETASRFVIWGECAPIRPHGRMSAARERAIHEDEARYGVRQDLSRPCLQRTLQRGVDLAGELETVTLYTDEKSTYPGLASEAFGAERLEHLRTNSELARTTWNPLFPINHTEAMMRDHMGRLRRESWLVSKQGSYLNLALQVWFAYRNYVRRRFNGDEQTPAQVLGFVHRRMKPGELLSWRQDWGKKSIHPLAWDLASVGTWKAPAAA